MNCPSFEEKIAQYVEGELDRVEGRGVEEHLRSCAACAEFADRLEGDRVALRTAPLEVSDVDFAAMRGRIREGIVRERRAAPALLMAAAILLAVGVAAVWSISHRQSPAPYQARVPLVEQAHPTATTAESTSTNRGADPLVRGRRPRRPACLESGIDCAANGGTRGSRADQGVHATTAPQPDVALEAALREFIAAETTPQVSTSPASPNAIRMATSDPNVILILLQQTSGDSNE